MLLRVFLFTVLSFLCICSSMKHASLCTHHHITIFIFLHIHTILNQDLYSAKSCLMSFVKPSHAFKVKSILDSSVTICLDKVVYLNKHQKIEPFTSLCWERNCHNKTCWSKKRFWCWNLLVTVGGKKMSLGKSLQINAESWKIILNPGTQLGSAGCLHIHYWLRLRSMWLDIVIVVVCTEWSLIVIIGCF